MRQDEKKLLDPTFHQRLLLDPVRDMFPTTSVPWASALRTSYAIDCTISETTSLELSLHLLFFVIVS